METLNDADVDNQLDQFEKSFSNDLDATAKNRSSQIIKYIIRQFNNHSLRGFIEYEEFRQLVMNASKGLFYLIFTEQFKFPDDLTEEEKASGKYSEDAQLLYSKTIFKSSFNLMYLLMTRVYKGKDYELIMAEINSRKPVLLSNAK